MTVIIEVNTSNGWEKCSFTDAIRGDKITLTDNEGEKVRIYLR
jgi:hypothetical protein